MLPAILIVCDRDVFFRESLRDFLLAAGYPEVEVAATVRHALAKIRYRHYLHILISVSTRGSDARRLAAIARRRQPQAKILLLVSVQDQARVRDVSFDYVLKEDIFSDLLSLM